jgi:hypothetical protein
MRQSDSPSTFSLPSFAVGAAYLHKFDLDSGLPLSPGFPSRGSLSVGLIVPQELMGPLKFSTPLLLHARRSDPGRPSSVSPNRRLRVGFRLVNNVATCSDAFNEAHFASGWCGHPSGLQHTLSTLHRCCSPVLADPFRNHRSASSARLDRGGGLALTPRGLSPRQKRQASLDALTTQLTCPARSGGYELPEAHMRAGSGAAPGSAFCSRPWRSGLFRFGPCRHRRTVRCR